MPRHRAVLLCLVTLALAAAPADAQITLGQVDDFQDGSTQGWRAGGAIGLLAPANVGDTLQLQTSGGASGSGFALVAFNTAQWAGDYLAAGVDAVRLDIDNSDNDADLTIRLGIDGAGGAFVTSGLVVPAMTSLQGALIPLTEDNLLDLSDNGNLAETLAGVTELRLLHNPVADAARTGAAIGAPVGSPPFAATVRFDNLTAIAIPEPTTTTILTLGLAGVAARRRTRRARA